MSDEKDNSLINISRPNDDLGITQEYNKENRETLWDDAKAKKEFKDKSFGDKKTLYDPISGEILHSEQTSAQKKYHMKDSEGNNISKEWGKHSAETDHINAIEDVHRITKNNPFLSDEDFKKIINDDKNYRILSKTMNTSKGSQNDFSLIKDGVKKKKNFKVKGEAYYDDNELTVNAKATIAKQKIKADIALHQKFATTTLKNVSTEFANGAMCSVYDSVVPLTSEGIRKAVKVAQGKESVQDAVKDMEKTVVNIAVKGGTKRLITDIVTTSLDENAKQIIRNIANSSAMSQVLTTAIMVHESAIKYISGDIDSKQFVDEIGEKGSVMVAGMIGGEIGSEIGKFVGGMAGTTFLPGAGTATGAMIGEIVGKIIGGMITAAACSIIVTTMDINKQINAFKLKEKEINRIKSQAITEIKNQRAYFKSIVESELGYWDETIQSGFDEILSSACEETYNFQGITNGLDKILSVFGEEVRFKTTDEFKKQLKKPFLTLEY